MDSALERGAVTVTHATNSDQGIQIIGHAKIGTINLGGTEDEKARRRYAVLRWLSPSDEAVRLQQIIHEESRINHRIEATGDWFIQNTLFQRWLRGDSKLTWVQGGMGCGKTVLFFLAVEKVREMCRVDVSKNLAYVYCTSRSPSGKDIAVLFRSLLRQFCRPDNVPAPIQKLYDDCDEGLDHRPPTVRELAQSLCEITTASGNARRDTYLLIDGLDELEPSERDDFLTELRPAISQARQNTHLLITSRPQRDIEESLEEVAEFDSLPVITQSVQEDIRSFVLSEIQSHRYLSRLPLESHKAILTRVVDESQGMFRWAFLQVQSLKALKPPVTPGKVQEKLQSLPRNLDETYARMLNDLDEYDKPKAKRALMWLVFSNRQLYIEELADACAIDLERAPLINDKLTISDVEMLLQDLILIQPPFDRRENSVDFQKHIVILVHASIGEFLVKERLKAERPNSGPSFFTLRERESHILLAQSCIAYLLCYNTYTMQAGDREYPLRRYAWYHWEQHIHVNETGCVETIPTVMLRRQAGRLLILIKEYLGRYANRVDSGVIAEESYTEDLTVVMDGVRHFMVSYRFDTYSLEAALNVPYFYPNFEDFCPAPPTWISDHTDMRTSCESSSFRQPVLPYRYRKFSRPNTQVRLLEILPAVDPETQIHCRLFECELSEAPPFAALSYSWETSDDKVTIMVEGHAFALLRSQFVLLQRMRSRVENSNPALWLDVLCLNLFDQEEMSGQVSVMHKIWSQAREVVVGLNDCDECGDKAVHLLADLTSTMSPLMRPDVTDRAVYLAEKAILKIDQSGDWEPILRIFDSSWWSRGWIVQEIVFGIKAVILFGSLSFNFNIVEKVMLAEGLIKDVLRKANSPVLAAIERSPGWHAAKQITYTRLDHQQQRQLTLPRMLWRFRKSVTTNPKDAVFAFLGLCGLQDSPQGFPEMSYHWTTDDVFLETSRWLLQSSKTLDAFSVKSAFKRIDSSPWYSWPLFLADRALERQPLNLGEFAGVDSFRLYSAAGTEKKSALIHFRHGPVLRIHGMTFDMIAKVLGPTGYSSGSRTILKDVLGEINREQTSGTMRDNNQRTVEARWRTLLADQWPLGEKLSYSTYRGVRMPPQTEDEEKTLLEIISVDHLPQLKGRRLIITVAGRLGLALEEVQPGDRIVIMPGGALPYVLRPMPGGIHTFLGESYVHDCMDGQIADAASQQRPEWWSEVFDII